MKNYEIEIKRIENLSYQYERLNDSELLSCLYECCGILLIETQKVEFIIHGLVSHFNENILKTNKQFEKLTPRIFLDNDENSKKKRKQTLGLIVKILLENNDFFSDTELNMFVKNRNIFVHSFWREFLFGTKIKNREGIINGLKFIIEFSKENIKWKSLFKGLLYLFAFEASKKENKEIGLFNEYESNFKDLLDYITEQKNIC